MSTPTRTRVLYCLTDEDADLINTQPARCRSFEAVPHHEGDIRPAHLIETGDGSPRLRVYVDGNFTVTVTAPEGGGIGQWQPLAAHTQGDA